MTNIKFIGELPGSNSPWARRGENEALVAELRKRLGQWAEVSRSPLSERTSVASRATRLRTKYADVEAVTRSEGDGVVLYARAVAE